jgi:hypothetical protein
MIVLTLLISYLQIEHLHANVSVKEKYTAHEISLVENAFEENGLKDPYLQKIVYAIGVAEGRRQDKYQFGIKHYKCSTTDFRQQAGWATCTVRNAYQRWLASDKSMSFIKHMALAYCPPKDDPIGHTNWVTNVTFWSNK